LVIGLDLSQRLSAIMSHPRSDSYDEDAPRGRSLPPWNHVDGYGDDYVCVTPAVSASVGRYATTTRSASRPVRVDTMTPISCWCRSTPIVEASRLGICDSCHISHRRVGRGSRLRCNLAAVCRVAARRTEATLPA